MVGNQKTKQLDGGQTRDHCSHPGLLPCFPPSGYCMRSTNGLSGASLQRIISLIFPRPARGEATSNTDNNLQDFVLCIEVFFFFLIHQDFCLGFLSVPSTLLTPGRCNLKMWRFFPWRQVMNARHFHLQSAEELIVPKNKVIFNLKLRSLTTKTIKQGCRY